jgi:hypothetical protein
MSLIVRATSESDVFSRVLSAQRFRHDVIFFDEMLCPTSLASSWIYESALSLITPPDLASNFGF